MKSSVTPPVTVPSATYAWTASDTDTPGIYVAEWEVTTSAAKVITFPNEAAKLLVDITSSLA